MTRTASPLLTIGIPLHGSLPFLDVISGNVKAVHRDDVEFVVSDRTGLDDAAAILAARHAGDPRVRVVTCVDGSDWVDHCNLLLRQARTRYFCWMPHDDSFPPGWVESLLELLEAESDLLMVFGRVEPVPIDRVRAQLEPYGHPPDDAGTGAWTVHDAVQVLTRWRGGYAFRGMFRRAPVVERGLYLPRTREGIDADKAWVFGMALLGRLRYVPDVVCSKRYYTGSASSRWRRRGTDHLVLGAVMAGYVVRFAGSPQNALVALGAVAEHTATRLARGHTPRVARRAVRAGRGALRL